MLATLEPALTSLLRPMAIERAPERKSVLPSVAPATALIMLIDDEPINIKVARRYLQEAGYKDFIAITDSTIALDEITAHKPDVIVLDVMMPRINGIELLTSIRSNPQTAHIPVLILTANCERETRLKALDAGATDFLEKPVDPAELLPRVRNSLTIKAHHDHLERQAEELEAAVQKRTAELAASRLEVVQCLARAAEFRDDNTGRHVIRVGRYAGVIARSLGLADEFVNLLELAAQLHDVGKIGIPDSILLKAGSLTPDEFDMVQRHCGFGKRVFESATEQDSMMLRQHSKLGAQMLNCTSSPLIQIAARTALTHHERWDGTGYPLGLAGEDIPIEGRIVAVADVFDALSSRRPYKPAFPLTKCFQILEEGRGKHFDPQILDAFESARNEIVQIQLEYADVN
ncbi:Cyclic di-GMP phosphodiesterase response regulator RpfG [Caulifigura coniformis]|uniref:Cyclic di-GMP phosphodiesterase response regulator RpfG n=1 Tax=Caulifigura coniformis TaxID=2527983 RepID=A0A517SDE2_9PLAN|nr:HD domain-containing phosphohydrolase [Caulifigura coniformis]QDT54143.1 Cyclic di-GMP phosphodiesterase response regulator RpfG [Caulifigura coniformis]